MPHILSKMKSGIPEFSFGNLLKMLNIKFNIHKILEIISECMILYLHYISSSSLYFWFYRLKQSFSLYKDTTPPQRNHTVTPTHIETEQYNP
jgi:hypothetical protein